MTQIIKQQQDGIEFFTITATGESGSSQSGLAILSGVTQQSVSKLEKLLTTKAPSEWLESWIGKELTLTTGSEYKNATIYKSEFCGAVIRHYAFSGNKVAQYSLSKFADIGINTWIQKITHWDSTPVDLQNIIFTAQKFLGEYLERQDAIESKVSNLEEKVSQHEGEIDRIFHPDGKYFSVRGYAIKLKQNLSKKDASNLGRSAAKISRQLGIAIDKLEDPRYGEVNIYHESILEQVFGDAIDVRA